MRSSRRLEHIDGLRAIAAVGVAWFHLYGQNGGEEARVFSAFVTVSWWGRFGVRLFFVISGFVLAHTLYPSGRIESASDIGRYFVRRSVRLDPTYLAVLLCYFVGLPFLAALTDNPWSHARIATIEDAFTNVLYFLPFFHGVQLIPVAWTLGIEIQLYVLFAGCMYVAHRVAMATRGSASNSAACVLVIVSIVGALWPLEIFGPRSVDASRYLLPHLNNFMMGVAACLLVTGARHRFWVAAVTVIPHAIAVVLHRNTYVAAGLISFVMIMSACGIDAVQRLLRLPFMLRLGRYSYVIYLAHPLVGALTIELLQKSFGGPAWQNVFYVLVGLGVTVLFAHLIWVIVEEPSIRWSKKILIGTERGVPPQVARLDERAGSS